MSKRCIDDKDQCQINEAILSLRNSKPNLRSRTDSVAAAASLVPLQNDLTPAGLFSNTAQGTDRTSSRGPHTVFAVTHSLFNYFILFNKPSQTICLINMKKKMNPSTKAP